jgi:hypothetical protein
LKTIYIDGIPDALKSYRQWVLWKNIVTEQYPRGKKIPYCVRNSNLEAGSSTDSNTWCSFKDAVLNMEQYKTAGIGFVLTKEARTFCVDIDKCIDDNGVSDFGLKVLDIFNDKTYTELSFHSDGLHIMGRGNLPIDEKGGERKGIEIYDSGRYIAITGRRKKSAAIDLTECQDKLDELLIKFPKRQKVSLKKPDGAPRSFNGFTISEQLGLSCEHIGYPTDAYACTNGVQGAHPFHGSTTGSNYCINTRDNTWYCFRHQSGGGALELYAISKGIIECEDSGRGCLNDVWGDVFEELEKDGYELKRTGSLYTIYNKRKDLRKKLKELGVL